MSKYSIIPFSFNRIKDNYVFNRIDLKILLSPDFTNIFQYYPQIFDFKDAGVYIIILSFVKSKVLLIR